jgi:heme/copper-type cytochrome/quinol oxidase subunit 2
MHRSVPTLLVAACLCLGGVPCAALADNPAPIQLTLKDHQFTPTEIHLPAGRPTLLEVTNADATPEEFEMRQLAIEKVIVGGGKAQVRLRPLGPGRYQFIGEYHEATAHGTIVVDPADAPAPK